MTPPHRVEDIYDIHHCPRCGRYGLAPQGPFQDDYEGPPEVRWSCSGCDGWWSTIELRRLP